MRTRARTHAPHPSTHGRPSAFARCKAPLRGVTCPRPRPRQARSAARGPGRCSRLEVRSGPSESLYFLGRTAAGPVLMGPAPLRQLTDSDAAGRPGERARQ